MDTQPHTLSYNERKKAVRGKERDGHERKRERKKNRKRKERERQTDRDRERENIYMHKWR
jgi:hypothetical protein